MKKFSLTDIFNTNPRSTRTQKDRYTNLGIQNTFVFQSNLNTALRSERLSSRQIANAPYKILDAPGMIDDFYLNLLDWAGDFIYIALSDTVYKYTVSSCNVSEIFKTNGYISCLKAEDQNLAIGCSDGKLYIFNQDMQTDTLTIDTDRLSVMDWNERILSIGTKTGLLTHYDTLYKKIISQNTAHKGEICGLKWSPDKKMLATGSNDNTVKVWKVNHNTPKWTIEFKSAVKALAWCPWRNGILCTGGGAKDKSIKIWDVNENKLENQIQVSSQVCTLNFIEKYRELVSGHGYSENNLIIWKANNLKKINEFGKHDSRVLNVALNHNGSCLVSISGDESLKFWKIYDDENNQTKRGSVNFR